MPRSRTPKTGKRIAEAPAVYEVAPDLASLTKVTRHGQITLPSEVRRTLGIEEGDLIEVQVRDERMILTPKRLVDKSQAYFWTKDWQAAEAEAEADIKVGRVKVFDSADALIEDLERPR